MPIKIPAGLPAAGILESENIFLMDENRALHQDIRPLKILIMNLMPVKITTETQLIRLLSNTSLQVEVTLLQTATRVSHHTAPEHMSAFYKRFEDVRDCNFDGMIITGAPVENMRFEDVDYWDELCEVIDWARTHVCSSMYICWAAQAALYHGYGIEKINLPEKMFGVFRHRVLLPCHPIARGFDEEFYAPHSRHTGLNRADIEAAEGLNIIAESAEAGVYIVGSADMRSLFVTGHSEYDTSTLSDEYYRDLGKGLNIALPVNYFPDNDPSRTPVNRWRGHAHLLFSNWLNYFVYQRTPYNISEIG